MDLFVFLFKSEHWVHGCLNNTDQDELKFWNDEVDSCVFSAFCIVQDFVLLKKVCWSYLVFKPFSLLDTKFIPPSISNKQTNKHCYCFWWLWKFLFGMIHMWAIFLHGQCILRHVLIFCMIIHKETFFNIYMNLFANELLFP